MKHLHKIIPVLLLLLLTRCIQEDQGGCLPGGCVKLLFTLQQTGGEAFRQAVETVDVVIFDGYGYYVTQKHVSPQELEVLTGTELQLAPGTYQVVCWGNAGTHSTFANVGEGYSIAQAMLMHTGDTGTGDPLYYAPGITNLVNPETFFITVPHSGILTQSIDFITAHNTLEVYVKGFHAQSPTSPASTGLPEVVAASLPGAYDFTMHALAGRPVNFSGLSVPVTTEDGTMAGIKFTTAEFGNDNPIEIHIQSPYTHAREFTVNLKQFLSDNHITLNPVGHDLIRILVEFKDVGVDVSLPCWGRTPVLPEY